MKRNKLLPLVLALFMALCLIPLPVSATCTDGCVEGYFKHICDNCKHMIPECGVYSSDICEDCGAVSINETTFPDANFREYLLSQKYGTDSVLSKPDINGCTSLYIADMGITSLKGIEYFTALTNLYCQNNQLTSLDLSNNPALTEIGCSNNLLTSLVLGNKPELTNLYCDENQLTVLDVTHAPKLKQLVCTYNCLADLDLTKCPVLSSLHCDENKLTELDTSSNTNLEYLYCYGNTIRDLDLSKNTMLRWVEAFANDLNSLDVTSLSHLTYLSVGNNCLPSIDVSTNIYLETLHCGSNDLTSIDVSKNTALKNLYVEGNKLTTLDVSNNTELVTLNATHNLLTSMDLSNNEKLDLLGFYSTYNIELDGNNQFDLSKLPGNFDVSRIRRHSDGATITGNILSINSEAIEQGAVVFWYEYDLGNGSTELFRLQYAAAIDRSYGENRYETAVKVADMLKSQLGVQKFDAVVLANGYNFADALSGSYLAAMKDAPILLTWIGKDKYNYLNEYTVSYVKENLADGGTVYILGGTSAVPQMVDDLLAGYNVKRLAGANRFETNLMILKEAGVKAGDEVLVCTATGFADSLSASAVGKPILLVHKKLSDSQKAYLGTLSNCSYTMIGGTSAVSDAVKGEFDAYGATSRLAGGNRFETSVKVAEKYFSNVDSVVLAYAKDFPDGLCGGPLAYAMDCPLILTMAKGEAKAAEYVQANDIREGLVLGGDKLISSESVNKIFN